MQRRKETLGIVSSKMIKFMLGVLQVCKIKFKLGLLLVCTIKFILGVLQDYLSCICKIYTHHLIRRNCVIQLLFLQQKLEITNS